MPLPPCSLIPGSDRESEPHHRRVAKDPARKYRRRTLTLSLIRAIASAMLERVLAGEFAVAYSAQ